MQRLSPYEILINFIKNLETRFEAIREKNVSYFSNMNPLFLSLTAPDRAAITKELQSIISGIENLFEKQEAHMSKDVRNRLLKFEIQVKLAYLHRVFFDTDQRNEIFKTEPCLGTLVSFFTRFLSAESWFHCQGDEQCQRDIFTLYSFIAFAEQDKVPMSRILLILKDKCDVNFIQLMTYFYLMVEIISFGMRTKESGDVARMRQLVGTFAGKFERHFNLYRQHQTNLGDNASLKDKLELAVAHLNAYRYLFMCFDLNNKRKKATPLNFGRQGVALDGGRISLVPGLLVGAEREEILKLISIEKTLRQTHLIPALKLFPAEHLPTINRDRYLSNLTWALLTDGLGHLVQWRETVVLVLEQCKGLFSLKETKDLAEYTKNLTAEVGEWQKQLTFLVDTTVKERQEEVTEYPERQIHFDNLMQTKKETDAEREKKTAEAEKAVDDVLDKFKAHEEAAEKAKEALLAWEKSRKKRYETIRQKRKAARAAAREARAAARAAEQGSPLIPSSEEIAEKSDEEENPTVVSLATVKSDPLKRLEFHDAKLSECIVRLMKATNFISRVLKNRIVDNKRISFETMDLLKIKLNSTLSDFESLKQMRNRFSTLASSLTPDEFNELNGGITESLLLAKEKEAYFETSLVQACELLTLVKEKREQQRKDFIEGLGAEIAESIYPDQELTPEQCYELGFAEFVRRGRQNAKNGLELSDVALERLYLKNAQTVFSQKLQTLTKKEPPKEDADKPQIQVSYPERIQAKWELLRGIPGDQLLFGDTLIDLLRGTSNFGLASTIDFSLTCRTIGEVLDAQNRFHVSKFNSKQGRLNLPSYETVNVFLTGALIPNQCPPPLFFTCDGVVGDESGHVDELVEGGLQDIKDGTLRTVQDAALTLKEHPQAVLIAVFRMSKGFAPDLALFNALFDWQPPEDLNIDYVKAIVAEHLKQLSPDDREEYVSKWEMFDLFQKIFKTKLTLRELERFVLPPPPTGAPFLFAVYPDTVKPDTTQAVVAESEERKVVFAQ